MKLWRAAKTETLVGQTFFARARECAEAYLDNPGFGGPRLYSADVAVDLDTEVLDIRGDSTEQVEALVGATGLAHPGAIGADEWLARSEDLVEALLAEGYLWVRLIDSYPEDCETWCWLGSLDADEPELILVD